MKLSFDMDIIVKVVYRKNLKMSEGKIASQAIHAVLGLELKIKPTKIRILKLSDKKFFESVDKHECYIQKDLGLTEVDKGTITAAAWIES